MTSTTGEMNPPPSADAVEPKRMKKVATASFVGTTIEFYDFGIYGTAAALVFPVLFFPALGPVAGTAAAFATFGVAFVARPFGSLLFGHFGDRIGRKRTLVATLLLMGIATFLVGIMPTANQIGVLAPILIVFLRILQGLAAGGEFAGAVLFTSEHAPKGNRGFWSMFPSLGGGAAIILANATFLATALLMSDETFIAWGWRLPFLLSALLVVVGLWIRLSTDETPVFERQQLNQKQQKADDAPGSGMPFLEAFKNQPKQIMLATGAATMCMSLTYIGGTFLVSYGTGTLGLSRPTILASAMAGGVTISLGVIIGGILSDRIGRRNVIAGAASVAILWALALFPILETASIWAFAVGLPVTMFISGIATGPLGAFLSEVFLTRYRYTAAGFSYSLAGMLGGAIPPLIAPIIIAAFGGLAFGVVLACICAMSLACVVAIGETNSLDLDRTDAREPKTAPAAG